MRRHVVVVLNWHGRTDTVACVRSLLEADDAVEILVVDNGSFDGAVEAVSPLDRVETLQLPRNVGFSGGMNRGIEHALEGHADLVTILNNDTIVPPGVPARLAALATGPVAVSPTVVYRDDPDRVWFAAGALEMPDGYPHHVAPSQLAPCEDGVRATELLAGCCITASAETWQAAGLFDERFFLNFEDSEWSVRAQQRGISLIVACDATIQHAVSASFSGAASLLGTYYFLRNGLLFSRVVGAGRRARLRFLRRFALRGMREGSWRRRWQLLSLAARAWSDDAIGRYGEAPASLRRATARWSK